MTALKDNTHLDVFSCFLTLIILFKIPTLIILLKASIFNQDVFFYASVNNCYLWRTDYLIYFSFLIITVYMDQSKRVTFSQYGPVGINDRVFY